MMTARQSVIQFCVEYIQKRSLEPTLDNVGLALFVAGDTFPGDSAEGLYMEFTSALAWTRLCRDIGAKVMAVGQSE